jgi:hypothetical protein
MGKVFSREDFCREKRKGESSYKKKNRNPNPLVGKCAKND